MYDAHPEFRLTNYAVPVGEVTANLFFLPVQLVTCMMLILIHRCHGTVGLADGWDLWDLWDLSNICRREDG